MEINDNKGAKTYILVVLIFLLLVMFIISESTYIKIDNSSITIEKYPSNIEHHNISDHTRMQPANKQQHHFIGGSDDCNITE